MMRIVILALFGALAIAQVPEEGSDAALFGQHGGESESDAALYGGQAQEEQASTQEEAGADNSKESDVALYAHNSADYAADSDAALYGASLLQVAQAPEAESDQALFGAGGGEELSDVALYGGRPQEASASSQEEEGDNSRESDAALYATNSGDYAMDSDKALYAASFLQVNAAPKKASPKIASLPEQGYEGKKVKHQNMKTITSDWGCEYGAKCKKSGAQGASVVAGLTVMALLML